MENYFESIKQYPNESKEITLKKARLLSNRLQELDELKTQHSRIFSCLSNKKVIDKWKRDLTDYKFELSDEMEKLRITQRADVLTNKLFITKTLSKLEEFSEGEKYIDIYYKYQNIFFIQNTDVCKNVIDAIKADDYERVATEMISLQSSNEVGQHFYKQARQALNYGLKNLIDTTINLAITLGNEIEIKDIRFIVDYLKRMETAKQFISTHLDEPILIQIDETLKEVEREIDTLRETQRKVVLEDSVKKYSELNISDYPWNPPTDIFEKFDEVKDTNPIYEQALKSIQKVIVDKFREELKLATLEKPPNPDNQHIRNFELAVKYLPEKVKSALEIELKHCKENIHRIILNIEDDLKYTISSGNLSKIKNIIQEYQNSQGMMSYANKGQELARKQFQEIKLKINENIQKNYIRETLEYVKQLYDSDIELGGIVVEIKKLCSEIHSEHMLNIDISKLQQECLDSLDKKVAEMCSAAEKLVEKISTIFILKRQDYDMFSLYYSNLVTFKKEVKVKHDRIYENIDKVEKAFYEIIESWETSAVQEKKIEKISRVLINMKHIANNIPSCQNRINKEIDNLLYQYKMVTNDAKVFAKIGTILFQDKSGVGHSIIAEHKPFQGFSLSLFNEKTRKHGIEYVLEHIRGENIDKELLKKRFNEFDEIYHDLIKKYLKPGLELSELIYNTKLIVGNVKQSPNKVQWDKIIRSKIPKLMAHIFALWTLNNANHFFEAEDSSDKTNYLLQPHAAQVISIFRMLGIGDEKEELKNNLVQIGTGEGKSITLGVTAAVLALLDFDVYSACYSEYLSQRDYNAFQWLFDSLGLLSHIHYGTFKQLCENIINENGQIRELVEQMISTNTSVFTQNSHPIKRAKILLIDEVDVFFSREFYGNLYTPSASLRDPTIIALANYIWENRKLKLTLNKVKATSEYQTCCQKFQNWELLISEAVKDMLYDVNNFESHDYHVAQDKIGYIEQDNVVFNVVYRYKTLFAYYLENEKGKISRKSLEENVSIYIKCGSFSYAEIPLQFMYIMGVTGTLETLSGPEKDVIKNVYKIVKDTYSPSVFGKNNLKFTEKYDIMIETSDDYFNTIKREIDVRLVGKAGKRAVLIFFDSEKTLKEFYESPALSSIKESVAKLTEEASSEEKEILIKRATVPGQITLLTRIFGRGTDFICYDESVVMNGGTHVIQTFLSEESSEEVQIKGRTARQGDFGSYSMVLLDADLEKFHITKEIIEDVKRGKHILVKVWNAFNQQKTIDTIYELLDTMRIELFKTQYETNRKHVEHAKEKHQVAQKFLSNLYSGDINSVREFLVEENKGADLNSESRTVCLMDATGSMVHLLNSCKNTVSTMFERASEILKTNNISSESFQIQFVVYRNYNSEEDKILQASPWETKSDNLRKFMNNIDIEGGWGNEAIEIGLWYANKEYEREPITQVILIGDAPPNTKTEVQSKRNHFGENYWKNTKFANATYYEDELAKLILKNIPVHGFFVDARAEKSFKEIATKSRGRSEKLDINSPAGSQMLTDLVTEEILRNVGGARNGDALVEAYRSKFGKSYKN
ncbi:unnamed protein product [Rotaria sp. Silwood2]|nr:unnamed protein product [Rotaria sp. Silwood2]